MEKLVNLYIVPKVKFDKSNAGGLKGSVAASLWLRTLNDNPYSKGLTQE